MTFTIVQNDTSPSIVSTLRDGLEPIDLSSVSKIDFYVQDEYERVVIEDDTTGRVNILDATAGKVEYVFAAGDTENVGSYKGEWQVTYSNGGVETFPSHGKVQIEVVEEIK